MSEKFTASNNVKVAEITPDAGLYLDGIPFYIQPDQKIALEEYFLAKRDEELGRWRDKDYPEYVVYPKQESVTELEPGVRVVNETTGRSKDIGREVIGVCDAVVSRLGKVAQAYFKAHEPPKPWLDAKPGEVWLITCDIGYDGTPAGVAKDRTFFFESQYGSTVDYIAVEDVKSAERIYPND